MQRSWLTWVLAGAVFGLCGCGDDDDDDGSPQTGGAGASGGGGVSAGSGGASGSSGSAGRGGSGGTSGSGSGGGAGTKPPDTGPHDDEDSGTPARDAGSDAGPDTTDSGVRDPGDEGDGDFTIGPNYTMSADLRDNGAPKGKSFNFTMNSDDSEIFRGEDSTLLAQHRHSFTRRIDVYVPARYQDGTAAPFLIIQDGPGPLNLVKNALDNLTSEDDPARKLPAFIAIAVANGGSDSKGSERGLEYDTMSDRYARLIQLEVLPAVLANAAIAQAYPGLAFTDDPEGRATMGCSSGGAAALTMGWFRPEWFARLITYSGTFVDQQDDDAAEEQAFPLGAWEYHSGMKLIENTARKPLRIFLHVSDRDLGWDAPESGHHNWVMANQRTAAALAAKGYHYRWITANGAGHCDGKVYDQTLAETLLWTWRGYPTD
jgi:enterochelin esterase-like enzyme